MIHIKRLLLLILDFKISKDFISTRIVPPIDHGNTPAHLAATGGHAECFNCCLQHNGRLDVVNDREETPMACARRSGHPQRMSKAGKDFF